MMSAGDREFCTAIATATNYPFSPLFDEVAYRTMYAMSRTIATIDLANERKLVLRRISQYQFLLAIIDAPGGKSGRLQRVNAGVMDCGAIDKYDIATLFRTIYLFGMPPPCPPISIDEDSP